MRFGYWLLFVAVTAGLSAGCGGGSGVKGEHPVYPASGRVTYKGKPLEGATVSFHSGAHDVGAYGTTDADGRFQMTTYAPNDGAVAGDHAVTITKLQDSGQQPKEIEPGVLDPEGAEAEAKSLIPERYADPTQSGLVIKVTPSGPNEFKFDLK